MRVGLSGIVRCIVVPGVRRPGVTLPRIVLPRIVLPRIVLPRITLSRVAVALAPVDRSLPPPLGVDRGIPARSTPVWGIQRVEPQDLKVAPPGA